MGFCDMQNQSRSMQMLSDEADITLEFLTRGLAENIYTAFMKLRSTSLLYLFIYLFILFKNLPNPTHYKFHNSKK